MVIGRCYMVWREERGTSAAPRGRAWKSAGPNPISWPCPSFRAPAPDRAPVPRPRLACEALPRRFRGASEAPARRSRARSPEMQDSPASPPPRNAFSSFAYGGTYRSPSPRQMDTLLDSPSPEDVARRSRLQKGRKRPVETVNGVPKRSRTSPGGGWRSRSTGRPSRMASELALIEQMRREREDARRARAADDDIAAQKTAMLARLVQKRKDRGASSRRERYEVRDAAASEALPARGRLRRPKVAAEDLEDEEEVLLVSGPGAHGAGDEDLRLAPRKGGPIRSREAKSKRSTHSGQWSARGRRAPVYLSGPSDSSEDEGAVSYDSEDEEVVVVDSSDEDRGTMVVTDLVRRCGKLTKQLRGTIQEWQLGSSASDRVNVVRLDGAPGQVVTAKDISRLCGGDLRLKDYQEVGVNWLRLLHTAKVNGVLADEMGLGKTVQTIAFFVWLHDQQSGEAADPRGDTTRFSSRFARREGGEEEGEEDEDDEDDEEDDDFEMEKEAEEDEDEEEGEDFEMEKEEEEEDEEEEEEEIETEKEEDGAASAEGERGGGPDRGGVGGSPLSTPLDDLSALSSGPPNPKPQLVVLPASVLDNWHAELRTFAPHLRVCRYYGSQSERQELRKRLRRYLIARDPSKRRAAGPAGGVDVVLTTYGPFERESAEGDRAFLKRYSWQYLVIDEAHSLKNAGCSRYRRLKELRTLSCDHALLLSGTPVQNSPEELLNLLAFLQPNIFTGVEVEAVALALEQERQEAKQLEPIGTLEALREVLRPFVLRRLKREVLSQMVQKTSRAEKMAMVDAQRDAYEAILEGFARRRGGGGGTKGGTKGDTKGGTKGGTKEGAAKGGTREGAAEEGTEEGTPTPPKALRALLTSALGGRRVKEREAKNIFVELRKAANHPLLLRRRFAGLSLDRVARTLHARGHFGDSCSLRMVREEIEGYSDFDLHQLCVEYASALGDLTLPESCLLESAKFKYLAREMPRMVAEGHRILLFSQWTRILDLLEVLMEHLEMNFCRLDGAVKVKERQSMIDTFNRSSSARLPVFLLSTRAGGQGINLTAADTVILHDVDCNPEIDRQAEDRCHRIGQQRPVTVLRLVCSGSVDEQIYEMGRRKQLMTETILQENTKKDRPDNMSGMLQEALSSYAAQLGAEDAAEDA